MRKTCIATHKVHSSLAFLKRLARFENETWWAFAFSIVFVWVFSDPCLPFSLYQNKKWCKILHLEGSKQNSLVGWEWANEDEKYLGRSMVIYSAMLPQSSLASFFPYITLGLVQFTERKLIFMSFSWHRRLKFPWVFYSRVW